MFTITSTITIDRNISDTYQFLLDGQNYPKWITDLKKVDTGGKLFSPGLEFDEITLFQGKEKLSRVVIRETILNKKIQMEVTEVISGPKLKPRRTWELSEENGKTKIIWTTMVQTGGIFKLLEFLLPKAFQKKVDEFMLNLKKVLENK